MQNFCSFMGKTTKLGKLSIATWSYDMESHVRKYVERYREYVNRTTQQLYEVSTSCLDDYQLREAELKSVGELSNVWSQLVLACLYLGRIGRLDISWSVNKLTRAISKWSRACVKRLALLIYYIHFTIEYKQYYHVTNTAQQYTFRTLSILWL